MDSDEDAAACPVCYELYDDPRNLPCGHSFCFSCITQVARQRHNFPCPSCRADVQLDIRGLNGLPKNYTLCRIIERQEKMSSAQCSEHKKSLDMFCAQCEVIICYKCLVKLHSRHNIMETEEIYKIKKGKLRDFLESTKQWQAKVQEKTVAVRLLRESLQKNIEAINANIDESFRRWTDNLEKQRKILRQYVNDKRGQVMKVFDDYLTVLNSAKTEINNIQSEMNTTLSKDMLSVVQLFGSMERSYEDAGKKAKETITTSFNPPEDLKIDISAPWMEEAIQNIKLFEPGQQMENSFTRSIAKFLEENDTLQRSVLDLRLKSEGYQSRLKDTERRLKRELDTSEEEKIVLKYSHKEEIGALKDKIRKLEESLRPAEAETNKLNRQLKNERKSKEEVLLRLQSTEAEINKLTRQLENERKSKEEALLRTKEEEQLQRQAARTEMKEKEVAKEECKRLKRKLHESEDEKAALKFCHEEEIGAEKDKIRKLEERLTIDKSSYEKREKELKTKCDELAADIASYKENWTKSEDSKIQLEIKKTELKNTLEEREHEIKMWTNRYNSLEEEKRQTEGELKRNQAMYNQLKTQHENERKVNEDAVLRLEAKTNQLTIQLDNERKAKEDALLRLSSMASNKLRDNDPNIADLTDPNRPTKLSEQFSELYDNEWTDAFDELEQLLGDKEEKEIISYLRDFVLEIHSFCSDISSSKVKIIEEAFLRPSVPSEDTKIPTVLFKTIKDGIKSMASNLLEHTRECVLGHLKKKYLTDPVAGCLQHPNVKRYIDKCTEVCWYMSVQDPQLVMDGSKSPGEKFDSNKHREYTKKGPYEEFVVWPVLYLYKGGQMLCKGVAQGTKKEINGQQ